MSLGGGLLLAPGLVLAGCSTPVSADCTPTRAFRFPASVWILAMTLRRSPRDPPLQWAHWPREAWDLKTKPELAPPPPGDLHALSPLPGCRPPALVLGAGETRLATLHWQGAGSVLRAPGDGLPSPTLSPGEGRSPEGFCFQSVRLPRHGQGLFPWLPTLSTTLMVTRVWWPLPSRPGYLFSAHPGGWQRRGPRDHRSVQLQCSLTLRVLDRGPGR